MDNVMVYDHEKALHNQGQTFCCNEAPQTHDKDKNIEGKGLTLKKEKRNETGMSGLGGHFPCTKENVQYILLSFHIYTHVIHAHVCVFKRHTCKHACLYAMMNIYISAHMSVNLIYASTCLEIPRHAYMYPHMPAFMFGIYSWVYINFWIDVCIHVYMCVHIWFHVYIPCIYVQVYSVYTIQVYSVYTIYMSAYFMFS